MSCAVVPTAKVSYPSPKTNEISIERVEVFQGLKRDFLTGEVKDFGKPVDVGGDIEYQKISQEYLASLKKELEEKEFVVIDNPNPKVWLQKPKLVMINQ